jgi:hypothetical protein
MLLHKTHSSRDHDGPFLGLEAAPFVFIGAYAHQQDCLVVVGLQDLQKGSRKHPVLARTHPVVHMLAASIRLLCSRYAINNRQSLLQRAFFCVFDSGQFCSQPCYTGRSGDLLDPGWCQNG